MRSMSDLLGHTPMTPTVPRYKRRLTDKILIAFHLACDRRDFEVAERLLYVLVTRRRRLLLDDPERRRDRENPVAAHGPLWQLRHPDSVE